MSRCEPVRGKAFVWRDEDDDVWLVDQDVACDRCADVWSDRLAECATWDAAMWAARVAIEAQNEPDPVAASTHDGN